MFYWNILFEPRKGGRKVDKFRSLNPCFTGIYSLSRVSATIVRHLLYSLNPCFTGIYSLRQLWKPSCVRYWRVLILVLLEYTLWAFVNVLQMRNISGLNPCFTGIYSLSPLGISVGNTYTICLNPCFTGIYSLSLRFSTTLSSQSLVLILVLLEYTLWDWRHREYM